MRANAIFDISCVRESAPWKEQVERFKADPWKTFILDYLGVPLVFDLDQILNDRNIKERPKVKQLDNEEDTKVKDIEN